jgi:probable HAF family extracellular repeat protein
MGRRSADPDHMRTHNCILASVACLASNALAEVPASFRAVARGGNALHAVPDRPDATVRASSDDGTVLFGTIGRSFDSVAFRWSASDGWTDLGALDGRYTTVTGASADGAVAVGASGGYGRLQAFRWTHAGMEALGGLSEHGGQQSFATAVSWDGRIVAGWGSLPGATHAFRWTPEVGMESLGTLPGGARSSATAMSRDGKTIVGVADQAGARRVFRWNHERGMHAIGVGAFPLSVSADGTVVAGYVTDTAADAPARAWMWTEATGSIEVGSLLESFGVDLRGWQLEAVRSVSADGRTISGTGRHHGIDTDWIATVPVPSAAALLGLGLVVALRRRR